jgi:hypothetical protein
MTKVGRSRPPFTKCSHSSSTYLPCVATFSGTSTPTDAASAFSSSSGVSGVIVVPAASERDAYIEMRSHWPPRSNAVPSAQVTVVEPATAIAAFWMSSWVRSAMPL